MTTEEELDRLFNDFNKSANMTLDELLQWRDDPRSELASESREPLNDVIRLKRTPRSNWSDADDGFNEVREAKQVLGFNSRMEKVPEGDTVAEPSLAKSDIALMNWGRMDSDTKRFRDEIF